ncbi:hypothetical protein SAMN05660209_04381 [Geodermatophilus africanus]|uniref:Uncharacterized protein n=1 Tax=Geodermatophilus africanus TaxID=1137993 RepID=A0A1H3PKM8_9ACTN|nr:hypothetical protein [Geodermatophilus africanus]SDZ01752.1 hypothetical protein SAMN05660209_04381 [Geodermatophilus africanus]
MFIATLECGVVLAYEARNFLPASGERVPCRLHGYCAVDEVGSCPAVVTGRALPRAPRRTQRELVEWLRERPVTTVHALRRERFTLRMLTAAAREGLVTVDLEAGRVSMH